MPEVTGIGEFEENAFIAEGAIKVRVRRVHLNMHAHIRESAC